MTSVLCRWLTACAAAVLPAVAGAISATAQTCTVNMSSVAFGNIDVVGGAAVDTTSTLTVTCSGGSASGQRVCISIDAGSAGDATSRELVGPNSSTARYDLYSDAAHTAKWGSWQSGYELAGVQLDVGQNSTTNVTVYGRFLASQQTVAPGSYASTFTGNPFIQYGNHSGNTPCPTGGLSASSSTSASATVTSSCNVSATNIDFGTVALLTGSKDAQGTLSILCSSALPYTVSLSGGNSGASDPTQRRMSSGGASIVYGLYQDSARLSAWGDTVGANTASGTGTGAAQDLTVFARIAAQSTPAPGTYTDTIVVTVSY